LKPHDTFLAFMMAQQDSQNVNIRRQFLFISSQFFLIKPQLLLRVIATPELTRGRISGNYSKRQSQRERRNGNIFFSSFHAIFSFDLYRRSGKN